MKKIQFKKMHGLGNDYIYINLDKYPIDDLSSFALKYSDRRFGIGGDGVVTYNKEDNGNYRMRIFNIDGSEGLMCGNAIRCVAKILYEEGLSREVQMAIETASGTKFLSLLVENNEVKEVRVDMGKAIVQNSSLQVTTEYDTYQGSSISVGNPHYVVFRQDDPHKIDLERIGSAVEQHKSFPDRVNFEIAQINTPHRITMRVFERGSGITLACGTGACATAVAAIHHGLAESPVEVKMPGGALTIEWSGNERDSVFMTGGATLVFEGCLNL